MVMESDDDDDAITTKNEAEPGFNEKWVFAIATFPHHAFRVALFAVVASRTTRVGILSDETGSAIDCNRRDFTVFAVTLLFPPH